MADPIEFVVVRKVFGIETVRHERGPATGEPQMKGFGAAVVINPFAGAFVDNILESGDALQPLGVSLATELADRLGGPDQVEGFGKGAIVGEDGELEHGALWHVPGGYAMRDILGGALAIVPSTKRVAGPGGQLDIPITHINASYVRSHFDSVQVAVPGAPLRNEMVLVLAMTTGPRVHERVGGLRSDEISERNGLR